MLHLPGGVAFGVDVGDFLQLQRPLEGQRVVDAAAEEEEIRAAEEQPAQLFELFVPLQDLLELGRNLEQLFDEGLGLLRGQPAARLAEVEAEDEQRGQLGGESLGGSHADLRPGVGVEGAVGLAGNHGADGVGDGQGLGALALGLALGGDGIGGFARLADQHGEGVLVDDGVAVAVLGAVVDLHRQARELLHHELPRQGRVPGSPAGDYLDLAEAPEVFFGDLHLLAQVDAAGLPREAPQQGVAHRAGLLEDFLQHKVLEAALFHLDGVPGDVLELALDGVALEVEQAHALGGEHGQFLVGQEEDVPGVVEHGGDVGSHEVLVLAQADDRRRARAHGDDLLGVARGEDGQGVYPVQLLDGPAHGFLQRPQAVARRLVRAVVLFDQVGDDFGVGLGLEPVALAAQLFFQGQVVLDDAVVDHDDVALAVAVGVGVLLAGAAVGGPAGVADAVDAVERLQPNRLFQVAELALAAADFELAVVAHHRDARRVVAAVFQPLQPVQQDGDDGFLTNVADDSAHNSATSGPSTTLRASQRPATSVFRWFHSSNSKRNSSITGLVSTSRAIRSTCRRASCSDTPFNSSSNTLPWRTALRLR